MPPERLTRNLVRLGIEHPGMDVFHSCMHFSYEYCRVASESTKGNVLCSRFP